MSGSNYLDSKDVRIFCEIAFKGLDYDSFTDRRVSPLAIGRKLGIDEKTVRVRVKKMEDDGFIKYYQAMPSLALFQLKNMSTYRFEALNIATKHRVIEYIQELPSIVEAIDYLGQVVTVSITGASPEEIDRVASRLAYRFELNKWFLGGQIIREPISAVDRLDWQKRAIINSQKQQGLIFYELEISVDETKRYEVIKRLSEIYAEKLWSVRTLAAGVLLANFFAFTLAEPEEAYVNTLKLEGVKSCSLFIFKETVEPKKPNWMDRLIEQKIASSSKSR